MKLPANQLAELIRWLVSGEVYASIQQKLEKRFGVKVTRETISKFYREKCAQELTEKERFIRAMVRREVRRRYHSVAKPDTSPATARTPESSPTPANESFASEQSHETNQIPAQKPTR